MGANRVGCKIEWAAAGITSSISFLRTDYMVPDSTQAENGYVKNETAKKAEARNLSTLGNPNQLLKESPLHRCRCCHAGKAR